MVKKYTVDLTEEERKQVLELTRKGKAPARKIKRAQILLLAHAGKKDETITEALQVGVATVGRIRRKFVEGGLEFALNEAPPSGGSPKLDGKQEAFLIALACSQPPEGRKTWTMQLPADHLATLGVVDSISYETVRRTLKNRS